MDKIIVAIISGVFGVIIAYFKWYLDNKDLLENNIDDLNLVKHPVFSRIDYNISQIDYSVEFDEIGRYMLISDVIKMNFKAIKSNLLDMAREVEELEREDISYDVHNLHLKYLNKIITEYTDVNNYKFSNLGEESRRTLSIFLNRFQLWQESRTLLLIERSSEINNSKYYNSEKVKVAALFDTYIGILAYTLQDGSKSLDSINGNLTGRVYRGEVIEG